MRWLTLLGICLLMAACVTTRRPDAPEVTARDIAVFKKSFEGTLVTKSVGEASKEEPRWWWPFSPRIKTSVCLQISVRNSAGVTRRFFDCSDDAERSKVLKFYYAELMKGEIVIVDLGYVDEGLGYVGKDKDEELLDGITRRSP